MPLTSPGNDDDTGENHQPTLRKNTAEPVEQTLKQNSVPSTRGERYARYTTEQKRAAVDHYLTHGRRASRTMRRLGYPSKEVLAAWIDELAPGERHVRRGPGPRRAQTPGSTPATATGLPTP